MAGAAYQDKRPAGGWTMRFGRKYRWKKKRRAGRLVPLLLLVSGGIYVADASGFTKDTVFEAAVNVFRSHISYEVMESCIPVLTYDAGEGEKTIYEYLADSMGELVPVYSYARTKDTQLAMGRGSFDSLFEGADSCGSSGLQDKLLLENRQEAAGNVPDVSDEEMDLQGVQEIAGSGASASDGASGTKISRQKLNDFDYLIQHFYRVDSTTTTNGKQLNAANMLNEDMTVSKQDESPQILIYHTHSQERFADSADESESVVGLGDYLTSLLEQKGYGVLHDTGKYDVPDRDTAYSRAAPALEQILKENPSIQVILDLHRDGVAEGTRLVEKVNGKDTATIMFFNGLSHTTTQGDIGYLANPNLAGNLAFSFQMQLAAAENYPGFSRCIYLKGYRYNLHYLPKSLLVEVGAQTNTYKEAKNAMEPLADILDKVLQGDGNSSDNP